MRLCRQRRQGAAPERLCHYAGASRRRDCDRGRLSGRSLKAQFKQADKVGAKLILVLGGDELAAGKVKVRDMQSHDEVLVDLANVVEAVRERL